MEFQCIRTYRLEPGSRGAITGSAEMDLVPAFQRQEGFRGYKLTLTADNRAVSVSTWNLIEQAAAADLVESEWVRIHLADRLAGLPDVFLGHVVIEWPLG